MNPAASRTFAEGFVKGFFDVVGAMLNATASYSLSDVADLTPDELHRTLSQFGAAIQARVKTGGAIVVLLPVPDLTRLASMVMGEAPESKDTLSDEDLVLLKDVCDPCIGGGASHFKEAYGREVELTDIAVVACGPASAGALANLLGDRAISASFLFSVPSEIQSEGVVFFSQVLENIIPVTAATPGADLTDNDIASILNQIGGAAAAAPPPPAAEPEPVPQAPPPPSPGRIIPGNIDMVLDIRLVATARLGRIEMPISDIMSLGPGSILEVGHLVDEPVELLVNDKLVARGDVVVVDEKFGLRITEIIGTRERIESLGHS